MSLVYLILGGNLGNREQIISEANNMLTRRIGPATAISALYESESWGFISEPFLNQVIAFESERSPSEILQQCLAIETQLGRVRKSDGYESRTIDIDLLYCNSMVINSPSLILPHPKIAERRFVLLPLSEIAPDWIDPVTRLTVTEMLKKCQDTLIVRRVK